MLPSSAWLQLCDVEQVELAAQPWLKASIMTMPLVLHHHEVPIGADRLSCTRGLNPAHSKDALGQGDSLASKGRAWKMTWSSSRLTWRPHSRHSMCAPCSTMSGAPSLPQPASAHDPRPQQVSTRCWVRHASDRPGSQSGLGVTPKCMARESRRLIPACRRGFRVCLAVDYLLDLVMLHYLLACSEHITSWHDSDLKAAAVTALSGAAIENHGLGSSLTGYRARWQGFCAPAFAASSYLGGQGTTLHTGSRCTCAPDARQRRGLPGCRACRGS